MTNRTTEQQLENARLAINLLEVPIARLTPEQVEDLIAQFRRLDAGERARNEAGRKYGHLGAEHGKKGGRPKKK